MTRRRSRVNYDYFARWAGSRAAQTRSREWLGHRARGDRPPVSLGECASETNGRGTGSGTNGHVLRRAPRALIPRRASRGGHTHAHTTKPRRTPRGGRLISRREAAAPRIPIQTEDGRFLDGRREAATHTHTHTTIPRRTTRGGPLISRREQPHHTHTRHTHQSNRRTGELRDALQGYERTCLP